MEELRFSYIWNPGKCPILRKGNHTVRCYPMNNVPFIYPGASAEADSNPKAAGGDSLQQQGQAGTDEDESEGPPELAESSDSEGDVDEEDVPKVRLRP